MLTYPVVNMPRFMLGQPGTGEAPRVGCTKLGVQSAPYLDSVLQAKLDEAKAAGLQPVWVPTGRTIAQGSKSETQEAVIWACPPQQAMMEKPDQAPQPAPAAGPPAGGVPSPSAFPTTTVLAVGGLAAAGLIAFMALR